jgi:hypothetical protein
VKMHIETNQDAIPARYVVRFLNGLLVLRYALASAATTEAASEDTLAHTFQTRSMQIYSSEASGLLQALGDQLLADPASNPMYYSGVLLQDLDGETPLDNQPYITFPIEGFVYETLFRETLAEDGFTITSITKGSLDGWFEERIEQVREFIKKILGQALDVSTTDKSNRQTQRRAMNQGLVDALNDARPNAAKTPAHSVSAGLLVVGAESVHTALTQMGATALTVE